MPTEPPAAFAPHPTAVRLADATDADGILAVYAPYVEAPATFEEAVPSPGAFRERIARIADFYPVLVAEQAGCIVGYAYAHRQAERAAYDWNAELSVYLAPQARGRGIGRVLYAALIELVRLQGVKSAYARVSLPNAPSARLHEALGFGLMGVQKNAGWTCGAWHDVAWYAKPLAAFEDKPERPVPFPRAAKCDPRGVDEALARANATLSAAAAATPNGM